MQTAKGNTQPFGEFSGFKPEALQRIANTMGYQGDMNNFNTFLQQNPAANERMNYYTNTARKMANGGLAGVNQDFNSREDVQKAGAAFNALNNKLAQDYIAQFGQPTDEASSAALGTFVSSGLENSPEVAELKRLKALYGNTAGTTGVGNTTGTTATTTPAARTTPTALAQQYIPQQQFPTGASLTEVQAQIAKAPGLPTGATIVPVGATLDAGQLISPASGQVSGAVALPTAQATTAQAAAPTALEAAQVEAAKANEAVTAELANLQAAQGVLSSEAQVQAVQGELSAGAMATGEKFDPEYMRLVTASELPVTAEQLVQAQGQDEIPVAAKIAQSTGIDPAVAAQGVVSESELPQPAQIAESEMAQAQAIISGGKLSEDATAVAAKLDSFTVDNGTLAQAVQGDVNAMSTVQGQLSSLMRQFDDGTPAWAAGAMRAANAVMAARGLGGSSMAGAAILQAAMESALPIAAQDAQTFAQMNLSNLDRRQQVALTNAAAQQGLALQNLNNQQQAALQNSANAFQLQAQDLSNMQQTVLANAQIKAALQGQNLSNRQQSNLAVAARYAEVADMNLNNRQQTALQNNMNTLQVELANLSNRQQGYIANAQLEAALQGKQIDARQQAAIANAARFSEAANIQFNAEQQAQLHNSQLVSTIGLQELNNRQAATLQNAAQLAAMDMTNLNNRQQAAVQNAQNFLAVDMANLSNQQQTDLFKSQQRVQSLFTDQAAENAAQQFNASSQNQVDQFFASLEQQTAQFNATQSNAQAQFNAGQTNTIERFNAEMNNQRDQFNAQNRLIIDQSNAQWRREIATADTAAVNRANELNATALLGVSQSAYNNLWQYQRDNMEWAWTSAENERQRVTNMAIAQLQADSSKDIQAMKEDYDSSSNFGSAVFKFLTTDISNSLLGGIFG